MLILWLDGMDAVVAVVTSSVPRTPSDVSLTEWHAGGLRVASTVRLSRLDCLEQSLLFRRIGMVSAADAQQLKSTWTQHVKPQF